MITSSSFQSENRKQRRKRAKSNATAGHKPSAVVTQGNAHLIQDLARSAQQALAQGHFDEAVERYDRLTAMQPGDVLGHVGHAVALQQCGRTTEAIAACRAARALAPENPDIANSLALAFREVGCPQEAIAVCQDILASHENHAKAYVTMGGALADLGRGDEALEACRQATALAPKQAELHNDLASLFHRLGRYEDSASSCRRALEIRPDFPEAINNLGNALAGLRSYDLAVEAFHLALRVKPHSPEVHSNLSIALKEAGRLEEAEAECRAALAERPHYPQALNNLGMILVEQGKGEEGEAACRASLKLQPDNPHAWNNLGCALHLLGRLDEAIEVFQTALARMPDFPKAYNNLGNVLKTAGRMPESIAAFRRAIALSPGYAEGHTNLGFALLLSGDLPEGWREYEWRWRMPGKKLVDHLFPKPQWQGDSLEGKTLLLIPEQGHGDQIQFCRYAGKIAERGGRVILMTYPPLKRLMATLPGVAQVVTAADPLPEFDCYLPLLSLPRVMGTTLGSIPDGTPYLHADPAAVEAWRRKLSILPGLKVGLVWAGDPRPHDMKSHVVDQRRSIDPTRLLPLLSVPGVSLVSLQMGEGAPRIARVPEVLRPLDVMAEVKDFADTAAIVAALDLVITVDTSMVHLAGAMGKPVWMLSRFDGCWRWLLHRDDSPWYPTLRLFRQNAPHVWEDTIHRVATELANRATSSQP